MHIAVDCFQLQVHVLWYHSKLGFTVQNLHRVECGWRCWCSYGGQNL